MCYLNYQSCMPNYLSHCIDKFYLEQLPSKTTRVYIALPTAIRIHSFSCVPLFKIFRSLIATAVTDICEDISVTFSVHVIFKKTFLGCSLTNLHYNQFYRVTYQCHENIYTHVLKCYLS